ncbi:MAG: phosphate/phosphite/phosphonate ABC transporter substrate-binding protein [Desulfovibrionaceae bacterium]|nr:phosphate/phosphite/phosphonate ABC transporter substrate-binding protein [Desulfovibrionaceae bacterium]
MKVRLRALCLLALAAGLIALAGCGDSEPMVEVDLSKHTEITSGQQTKAINYAYLPQYSHTISYKRHHPLIEYLMRETGLTIRQVFPNTFYEHVKMVERGEIDISFSNPLVYINIAEAGAKAFARIEEGWGCPDFRGQIICRRDNPKINTLADCRGKRWIAVDPLSAGGFLFALGLFKELGMNRSDFAEIAFSPGPGGKQEKVVVYVYAGKYDFGTIREGTLMVMRDRLDIDQIKIIAETRPYPGWVYAHRQGLDPEVVEKISRAMFKLNPSDPEHAAILKAAQFKGIIPARDKDYDPVRRLAVQLGLTVPEVN